jgi:predicted lactoylglutathione lyase
MVTQIFVNLPVKDLDRSKAFFAKLGYSFNPKFTDATAACMVISENIYAMLLTESKFKEFTTKPIANAKETTEVLVCLSLESKAKVNDMVGAALSAGALEARPAMDHGFMFGRSFHDLDGHIWEIIWMDPKAATEG